MKCKTCGYEPPLFYFPTRIPSWACADCQDEYEAACERRFEEARDRKLEDETRRCERYRGKGTQS